MDTEPEVAAPSLPHHDVKDNVMTQRALSDDETLGAARRWLREQITGSTPTGSDPVPATEARNRLREEWCTASPAERAVIEEIARALNVIIGVFEQGE